MGYIGSRKALLPEVIKKYADAKWSLINEYSGDIEKDGLELFHEVCWWFNDCELFDEEDYPGVTLESLLPERVMEIRNEYYDTL